MNIEFGRFCEFQFKTPKKEKINHFISVITYTDEIIDYGAFFQLVSICGNMLRPLVEFCTVFFALF